MAAPEGTATHQSRPAQDVTQSNVQADNKPGTSVEWIPCTAPRVSQDIGSQLGRRRAASRRTVPLECGCSDPWPCSCARPQVSELWVDAGRDAALHILSTTGKTPLLEIEVLRALWRRGGTDRRLAQQLHQLTDGQVA